MGPVNMQNMYIIVGMQMLYHVHAAVHIMYYECAYGYAVYDRMMVIR
jgi:hypothetical protein